LTRLDILLSSLYSHVQSLAFGLVYFILFGVCYEKEITMVTIKTKHGEFKYKDWQWYLAWLLVFLCGVVVGIIGGL